MPLKRRFAEKREKGKGKDDGRDDSVSFEMSERKRGGLTFVALFSRFSPKSPRFQSFPPFSAVFPEKRRFFSPLPSFGPETRVFPERPARFPASGALFRLFPAFFVENRGNPPNPENAPDAPGDAREAPESARKSPEAPGSPVDLSKTGVKVLK
jgi:hypothetical protein